MLVAIWAISITLAAIAIIVMAILVVRRLIIHARQRRHKVLAMRLRQQLIVFTADHDELALQEVIGNTPPRVAIDVSTNFLELLRGDDKRDILMALAAAGLPASVRKQLANGNEAEQIAATEFLVSFPFSDTRQQLLAALDQSRREVRISSAIALAKMDALPPLPQTLEKIGPRGRRSGRLIDLFRAVPADRHAEVFSVVRDVDLPAFIRASAIEALGHHGGFEYLEDLQAMSRDNQPEVCAAVLRALGLIGHPRSTGIIETALTHANWEVRLEGAEAAGKVGGERFAKPLSFLLGDEEWSVRYMAAKSLITLGDSGRQELYSVSESRPSRRQRTAALVLAEEGILDVT